MGVLESTEKYFKKSVDRFFNLSHSSVAVNENAPTEAGKRERKLSTHLTAPVSVGVFI